MKSIKVNRFLSTHILPEFENVISIEIDDKCLAEGAFGEVYLCISINSKAPSNPQVIKLFKEDSLNKQDHNFNTIQKLQHKLSEKNLELKRTKGKDLLAEYPSLLAVPQLSFEGSINGKMYRGFSSSNLKKMGFEEFVDILDKPVLYRPYQKISIDKKMLIAYHLVSAFKLLQEIFFIHADLKPEAIFINTNTCQCAIIDFDSGAVTENPNDAPNVWGAPNDWVAPEIWEQLKQINKGGLQRVKVNLLSDLWSVAVGVHYILTTTHPLFFLTELSPRVTKEYFGKYKWPNIAQTDSIFNLRNKNIYDPIKFWLENSLPKSIYSQLFNTVNYGYANPIKRTTYNEWRKVLSAIQEPPEINVFSTNKHKVLIGHEVLLEWKVSNGIDIRIDNGLGVVKAEDSILVKINKSNKYTLSASNVFGRSEKIIEIEVYPNIDVIFFQTSGTKIPFGSQINLSWKIFNSLSVQLILGRNKRYVSSEGNLSLTAEKDIDAILSISALDGISVERRTIPIKVFKKVLISNFLVDEAFIMEGMMVSLTWDVENASQLILTSPFTKDEDVTGKKRIKLKPKQNAIYNLIARNELYSATDSIKIEVQPLPSLPRLDTILPHNAVLLPKLELKLAEIASDAQNDSFKIFDNWMKKKKRFKVKGWLKLLLSK